MGVDDGREVAEPSVLDTQGLHRAEYACGLGCVAQVGPRPASAAGTFHRVGENPGPHQHCQGLSDRLVGRIGPPHSPLDDRLEEVGGGIGYVG